MKPVSESRPLGVVLWRLRPAWPVVTLFTVCLLLAVGGDELRALGRYERGAIDAGEYWRLVSGHLVHLGVGHLWPNLAALAIIGVLFDEVLRGSDWWRTAIASAAAIDAGLYALEPDVLWYVGLSGVLHGFVAAGALVLLLERQALGVVLGVGLVAKLAFEQLVGALPFTAESVGGPVIVAAHLYGSLGAFAAEAATQVVRRRASRL
jgi:rhomboid family GlyGly-CTERM serine protease